MRKGIYMSEKKIATIYDMYRLCHHYDKCRECPLANFNWQQPCRVKHLFGGREENIKNINDIILKWCEEHPIKTRLSEFLKMFPNARIKIVDTSCVVDMCPIAVNKDYSDITRCQRSENDCDLCKKDFWSQEIK